MLETHNTNPEDERPKLNKLARILKNPREELIKLLGGTPNFETRDIEVIEGEIVTTESQTQGLVPVTEKLSINRKIPEKGTKAYVPDWKWVTILNERGVCNRNIDRKFGDTCGVEEGGTVTVVGYDNKYDRILVRYQTPGNRETAGTPCPSGTLFFLTPEEFNSWTPTYQAREHFRQEIKGIVRNMLNGE